MLTIYAIDDNIAPLSDHLVDGLVTLGDARCAPPTETKRPAPWCVSRRTGS